LFGAVWALGKGYVLGLIDTIADCVSKNLLDEVIKDGLLPPDMLANWPVRDADVPQDEKTRAIVVFLRQARIRDELSVLQLDMMVKYCNFNPIDSAQEMLLEAMMTRKYKFAARVAELAPAVLTCKSENGYNIPQMILVNGLNRSNVGNAMLLAKAAFDAGVSLFGPPGSELANINVHALNIMQVIALIRAGAVQVTNVNLIADLVVKCLPDPEDAAPTIKAELTVVYNKSLYKIKKYVINCLRDGKMPAQMDGVDEGAFASKVPRKLIRAFRNSAMFFGSINSRTLRAFFMTSRYLETALTDKTGLPQELLVE
jgi:hypothetical protein